MRGAVLDESIIQVLKTADVGNEGNPSWVEVVRRKRPMRGGAEDVTTQSTTPVPASSMSRLLQKRQPRNKAVVHAKKDKSATYASIIKQVRVEINITDLQIKIARTRFRKKG